MRPPVDQGSHPLKSARVANPDLLSNRAGRRVGHAAPIPTRRGSITSLLALGSVHLWIVEGAIRKWIPGTNSAAYFARDLVLVVALLLSLQLRRGLRSTWSIGKRGLELYAWGIVMLSALQGAMQSAPIAVYVAGIRNYLAPILLPYLILRCSDEKFSERAARIVLAYAPIQALLTLVQVSSGSGALVNIQPGGEGAYFTSSRGVVRASGSFSAPAGLIAYATLALGLAMVWSGSADRHRRRLAWTSLLCTGAVILLGGSRGAVFGSLPLVLIWLARSVTAQRRGRIRTVLKFGVVSSLGGLLLIQLFGSVFSAFTERFENARSSEDLTARIGDAMVGFLRVPLSWLGDGIGSRSVSGIAAGSTLSWVENDLQRWVAELGLLGMMLSLVRVVVGILVLVTLVLRLRTTALAPLILGSILGIALTAGSITTQPSVQGQFGLVLALFLSLRLACDEVDSA